MSVALASGTVNSPAIDNLVQSSLKSENKDLRLEWIPWSEITDIESSQIDNVYYVICKQPIINLEIMKFAHQHLWVSLLEYTHFQHTSTTMMSVNLDDIPNGLAVATNP